MTKFRVRETRIIVDWPCVACGSRIDNDSIVCESVFEDPVEDIRNRMRICSGCLKGGPAKIDQELKAHAERLRDQAASLESAVGQYDVPPFEEFERAKAKSDAEWLRRHPQPLHVVSDDDDDLPF
jgi:hypothetical protein